MRKITFAILAAINVLAVFDVFSVELPEFVKVHQRPTSIVTFDGFYQFITPIVRAQQSHFRENMLAEGPSQTPQEAAKRINFSYLKALEQMGISESADEIERFIVLVFTRMEREELYAGCLHYFRAMGRLNHDSLVAINDFAQKDLIPDDILALFYQIFEEYEVGNGVASLPAESKKRLIAMQWKKVETASVRKNKVTEAMLAANVSADLLRGNLITDTEKAQLASKILHAVSNWRKNHYEEDALDLLQYAATKFDPFSGELPEDIYVDYILAALDFLKSLVESDKDFRALKSASDLIMRFSHHPLTTYGDKSVVYDMLRRSFLSEDLCNTTKALIARNFLLMVEPPAKEIDEQVLRIWKDADVTKDVRYELLYNLVEGTHPDFKPLLLEEIRLYETKVISNAEDLNQEESRRMNFLVAQVGRALEITEIDENYANKSPIERLSSLLSSGRLEQLR